MRISDGSSDLCSSDLAAQPRADILTRDLAQARRDRMQRAGPAQGAVQDPEIACLGWNRPQETFRRPRQPEQAQQTSDTPKRFIGPVLREGSTKHVGRLDHITLEGQLKQQSGRANGKEGAEASK